MKASSPASGLCLIALLMVGTHSHAQPSDGPTNDYLLDLELGAEYSDNRGRFDSDGPDDTAIIPRLVLDLFRSGSLLEARIQGSAEYRNSIDNAFDDELRANLATLVDWNIVDDSLTWTFQDVASVEPINLFAVDAPDNLQQTNVFVTGPTWVVRPGAAWEVLLDARFIHSYAEEVDDFNSERLSGAARLLRRMTPTRTVSAGVEVTDVGYRNPPSDLNDYERLDATVRLTSAQARVEMDLAAGYTWIEPDFLNDTASPLLRLAIDWSVSDQTALRLAARHELSDSVRQLATSIDALDLPISSESRVPVGAELYELDEVELGWHSSHQRGDWSIIPVWRDYEFETETQLDYREFGGALAGNWRVSPVLTVQGRLEAARRRFDLDQRRDTDYHGSLFLSRRFSPRWSGRIGAVRHERDSNAQGADSVENIAAVFVTFHAGR